MNTFRQFVLLLLLMMGFLFTQAQSDESRDHTHKNHEIGIANSLVYFIDGEEFSYGLHVHYLYSIPHSFFGLGLAYERIFNDQILNSVGMVLDLRLIDRLHFTLSPGLTAVGGGFSELEPSFHIETFYEFDFNSIHIGPILEFAFENEDFHINLGLHIGFGF